MTKIKKEKFLEILSKDDKALPLYPKEIGCIDPSIVAPIIIFTILHVPWYFKPNLMPKALLSKLVYLLIFFF